MNHHNITAFILSRRRFLNLMAIEREIGLPKNHLQQFVDGKRQFNILQVQAIGKTLQNLGYSEEEEY